MYEKGGAEIFPRYARGKNENFKKDNLQIFSLQGNLAREILQAYYDGLDKRSAELLASQHLSEEEKSKELLSVYFERCE